MSLTLKGERESTRTAKGEGVVPLIPQAIFGPGEGGGADKTRAGRGQPRQGLMMFL